MTRQVWLCLPAVAMYLADVGLTLSGQSSAYWQGNYGEAHEVNPIANWLLVRTPWLFLATALLWFAVYTVVMVFAPRMVARGLSLFVTVAHAFGAASWLIPHGVGGWVATVVLLIAAERLLTWSWRKADGPSGVVAEVASG